MKCPPPAAPVYKGLCLRISSRTCSESYSLQTLGYFRVHRIPNPIVTETLKDPHSLTGPPKVETHHQTGCVPPPPTGKAPPGQLGKGNYYQNKPDRQPLLLALHARPPSVNNHHHMRPLQGHLAISSTHVSSSDAPPLSQHNSDTGGMAQRTVVDRQGDS